MNGMDRSSSLLLLLIEDPKAKIIRIMHIIEPRTPPRAHTHALDAASTPQYLSPPERALRAQSRALHVFRSSRRESRHAVTRKAQAIATSHFASSRRRDAVTRKAAPADPLAKEETQRAPAAETAPSGDAEQAGAGGGAGEEGETVVVDAAAEAGDGEGEEEGECRFCLFMKGGGCKEEFVGWEKCVEEAEAAGGDVVERCYEATAALRRCMDVHANYYEPILRAERAMAEDLEAAKAGEASEPSLAPSSRPAPVEEDGDKKNQAEEVDQVVVSEKEDLAA